MTIISSPECILFDLKQPMLTPLKNYIFAHHLKNHLA